MAGEGMPSAKDEEEEGWGVAIALDGALRRKNGEASEY